MFNFGRLFLEGKETRVGKANALFSAWTPLSGKPYNEQLLSKWLVENATFLPSDERDPFQPIAVPPDASTHRADIQLPFP